MIPFPDILHARYICVPTLLYELSCFSDHYNNAISLHAYIFILISYLFSVLYLNENICTTE